MTSFDDWVTNPSIKLVDVNEFMKDLDNIGRKFKGEYLILTTSGSSGEPLVLLNDKTTNNIMGGTTTTRAFARKKDFRAFIKAGAKTMA